MGGYVRRMGHRVRGLGGFVRGWAAILTCMFTLGGGQGWGEVREKVEGQQFTRVVENTNMKLTISLVYNLN
jgi:hypothetical protein